VLPGFLAWWQQPWSRCLEHLTPVEICAIHHHAPSSIDPRASRPEKERAYDLCRAAPLGHSNIATTTRCMPLSDWDLTDTIDRAFPAEWPAAGTVDFGGRLGKSTPEPASWCSGLAKATYMPRVPTRASLTEAAQTLCRPPAAVDAGAIGTRDPDEIPLIRQVEGVLRRWEVTLNSEEPSS